MKLTIVGAGAMAMAMAKGLESRYELEFVVRDISKVDNNYSVFNINGFDISDKNIILAIKPYALKGISSKLVGEADTIYSLLAGTSIDIIKDAINAKSYIRTMPNISAKFGASTTIITGDINKRRDAIEIFSSIGDTFWVETQKEIDIATAVAGSGPAFLALVAEAMMDGLVREGMRRIDAIEITNSLFRGFAPLISSNHPAMVKDLVMSPSGTTSAGYAVLESMATRGAFIQAIGEAFKVTQR
jgi:pyrroline-5-carboxylate reductase